MPRERVDLPSGDMRCQPEASWKVIHSPVGDQSGRPWVVPAFMGRSSTGVACPLVLQIIRERIPFFIRLYAMRPPSGDQEATNSLWSSTEFVRRTGGPPD